MDDMRVTAGGDAVGGWMVDIHDGDNCACYSPEAADADAAVAAAKLLHERRFYPAEADARAKREADAAAAEAAAAETAAAAEKEREAVAKREAEAREAEAQSTLDEANRRAAADLARMSQDKMIEDHKAAADQPLDGVAQSTEWYAALAERIPEQGAARPIEPEAPPA